jgi:hypothetical protein
MTACVPEIYYLNSRMKYESSIRLTRIANRLAVLMPVPPNRALEIHHRAMHRPHDKWPRVYNCQKMWQALYTTEAFTIFGICFRRSVLIVVGKTHENEPGATAATPQTVLRAQRSRDNYLMPQVLCLSFNRRGTSAVRVYV